MMRAVECLDLLPEEVHHEFIDWCIFGHAKAAIIGWLRLDNLVDLAQIIEDASDYQTLYDACQKVYDAINEMWDDPKLILQQKTRVQAFRAATLTHSAIWFVLTGRLDPLNISGLTISTVTVDEATQKAGETEQDQKLLEICQKHNVDIDRFLKQ